MIRESKFLIFRRRQGRPLRCSPVGARPRSAATPQTGPSWPSGSRGLNDMRTTLRRLARGGRIPDLPTGEDGDGE